MNSGTGMVRRKEQISDHLLASITQLETDRRPNADGYLIQPQASLP